MIFPFITFVHMINLAVFVSGSGSNALQILEYFKNHLFIKVEMIYCNNPNAAIVNKLTNDERLVVGGKNYYQNQLLEELKDRTIDAIVLAGFLWKIPNTFITHFPEKIINIHPSLLPKFGGKGFYGEHVFKAVLNAKEKVSGISIHLVNENFDEGAALLQRSFSIELGDDLIAIKKKTQALEHRYFAPTIEKYFYNKINNINA